MPTPNWIPRLPHNGNPRPSAKSNPQSLSDQNRRQVIAANSSQSQTQRPKLSPVPIERPAQSTKVPPQLPSALSCH